MIGQLSSFPTLLADSFGRTINYLRLSLTDRCNLGCVYCRGVGGDSYIPHDRILRYEQMLRLVGIMARMGVRKVRVTGGEPFARKDCVGFLSELRERFPDLLISITTNGTLLAPALDAIARIRPISVNVSLDSLDAADYAALTGKDCLATVRENIQKLIDIGLKVKINSVIMAGIAQKSLPAFVELASRFPIDVRFIEFMPMGKNTLWQDDRFLPCGELLKLAQKHADLQKAASDRFAGPAAMYSIKNGAGRLGFISAISSHFCHACNRLRLTASGGLRTCLFDDKEYALKGALENKKISDQALARIIAAACARKPLGSAILSAKKSRDVAKKNMVGIGG